MAAQWQTHLQRQLSGKLTTQQSATPEKRFRHRPYSRYYEKQYQLTATALVFKIITYNCSCYHQSTDSLNKAVNDMVNKGIKAKLGSVDAPIPHRTVFEYRQCGFPCSGANFWQYPTHDRY